MFCTYCIGILIWEINCFIVTTFDFSFNFFFCSLKSNKSLLLRINASSCAVNERFWMFNGTERETAQMSRKKGKKRLLICSSSRDSDASSIRSVRRASVVD